MKNKHRIKSKNLKGVFPALLIGLSLGMCSAFLGIGGGPINVSVIVFLFSLPLLTDTVSFSEVVPTSLQADLSFETETVYVIPYPLL